jgi:2,3-bisphosphoglycerate-dependent phosphoglycerate mutase
MYGSLTGFSKQMIKQQYGEKQFKKWRRGYDTRPPPISSFSVHYPGNDDRYVKYINDIRPSFSESLIRSLSHRRVEIHKKFPKTESLKDCMERTIPYFRNVILPGSIAKGKNVLIASSENAIRGLLMHLCEIPPERIHEVEIPTGLPMVYDSDRKSIRLLDDGESSSQLPWEQYDFGTAPDLLFKP